MTFDALETGLKFDEFSWLPWGSPGSKAYARLRVTMPVPRRTVNSQIASSTMQDTQCNIKHAGIKGYEKTWMQNERTKDTGYRMEEILRSLVAPLKRGRRIFPKIETLKLGKPRFTNKRPGSKTLEAKT